MKDIYAILDEKASCGQFTTLAEIVEACYGHKVDRAYSTSEANRLKTWLYRHKEVVEYQNGKTLEGGFRYRPGCEYAYRSLREGSLMTRMDKDLQTLFKTGGLQMLFDGETSFDHLIEMEWIELQNLSLVKELAKCLNRQDKRAISFKYRTGYGEVEDITMHPHLLKEYNSRWFLFGYVVQADGTKEVVNFSLDRIGEKGAKPVIKIENTKLIPAPKNFYEEYFKDIVGVTRHQDKQVETLTIRTTDYKVHNLLLTKPIHPSQQQKAEFDPAKGEGEFTIRVIPNIELQTRLLGYGPGVYVTGDGELQQELREKIARMARQYGVE